MQIESVAGPVETSQLGSTYMHEHVFACTPGLYTSYPHLWDGEAILSQAVDRLRVIKTKGIDTIVDLTPADFHRDPALVQRVSQESGVTIIHATGAYWYTTLFFQNQEVEELVQLFVHDIVHGMNGTSIRAGILKCGTGEPGVTPANEKLLRAVARAHRQTGVPISTHTHMATHRGLDQQRIFREEGVDLGRVVIGHSNDTVDVPYLEEVIDNGSYISMDRFGIDAILPEEDRIELLVEMCRRGYHEKIVLSHDTCVTVDWRPRSAPDQPHWNWNTIVDRIVPAIQERGVNDGQIRAMLVDNPRRIFERQGAY